MAGCGDGGAGDGSGGSSGGGGEYSLSSARSVVVVPIVDLAPWCLAEAMVVAAVAAAAVAARAPKR